MVLSHFTFFPKTSALDFSLMPNILWLYNTPYYDSSYRVCRESVLRSAESAGRRCFELREEVVTRVELRSCCLPLKHSSSPSHFLFVWSRLSLDDKTQQDNQSHWEKTRHIALITKKGGKKMVIYFTCRCCKRFTTLNPFCQFHLLSSMFSISCIFFRSLFNLFCPKEYIYEWTVAPFLFGVYTLLQQCKKCISFDYMYVPLLSQREGSDNHSWLILIYFEHVKGNRKYNNRERIDVYGWQTLILTIFLTLI